MLFMIQKQILHSFYQFFPPPLLATNAFHDSNANITFLLSIFFPPPSWQLMLFMIQKQILHSFYHFFPPSPLLATNAFHDSNANITFLLSIFSTPSLLATNAFHGFKNKYYNPFIKFFPPPPIGN